MRDRRSRTALALGVTLALGGGGALALALTEDAPRGGPAVVVAPTSTATPRTSAPRPASRPARITPPRRRPRAPVAVPPAVAPSPPVAVPPAVARSPHRGFPARAIHRPPIDPHRVLIRFAPGVGAGERAAARRAVDARVVGILGPQHIEVWRVAGGRSVTGVLARYHRDRRIALAAPNRRYTASAAPDDPFFGVQWGLDNTGQGDIVDEETTPPNGILDQDVDAPEAFDALGLGHLAGPYPRVAGFTLAIIDTGVYRQHEDLAGKVVGCVSALNTTRLSPGCNDDNGHGTHLAGIAAATANNGKGISGVAPEAGIYACKALGKDGSGDDVGIITCMNDVVAHRAQYGIHVLSLSLGGADSTPAGRDDPLEDAVNRATAAGILVVAAAGNEYESGNPLEFPAGYANVVSVGASDRRGKRSTFSEVNSDVEVSAPGTAIASTWPFDSNGNVDPSSYIYLDGTSMATPAAAAVAATIAARRPSFTPAQVRAVLDRAVDDLGAPGRDDSFGYGRVNLAKAIALTPATTSSAPTPTMPTTPTVPRRTPTAFAFVPTGYLALAGRPVRGRNALARLRADDGRHVEVGSVRRERFWISDLRVTTTSKRSTKAVLKRVSLSEDGNVSRAGASRRVALYEWVARRWVSVAYLRRAPTSDRRVRWTTASRPARFVAKDGRLRARITATGARGLRTRTDLVRFTLGY